MGTRARAEQASAERGVKVAHILADGSLESHESTLVRLLDVVGLPSQDLFRSRQQLIEEAMARQEARIAYVDVKQLAAAAAGERR